MKSLISALAATLIATSILLGQGSVTRGGNHRQRFWGWEPTKPPPLTLPEAYALAITQVGPATNRFYCVSASCLEMANYHFRGWAFSFADTNGQRARVEVSFDKEFRVDQRSRELLANP